MNTLSRALTAFVGACALLASCTSAALAAPTTANLRVEGPEGHPLDPATNYATDTVTLATDTSECGPDSNKEESRKIVGPSAMGLIDDAKATNRQLRPYLVSDAFHPGLIVCQIGDKIGSFATNTAWL